MTRAIVLLISLAAASASGCSICCTPYDYDYAAYGGSLPIEDAASHGRAGSMFHPQATVAAHGHPPAEPMHAPPQVHGDHSVLPETPQAP